MRVWIIDDLMSEIEARFFVPEPAELAVSTPEDDDFGDRLDEGWDLILVDENLDKNPDFPPSVFDGSTLVAWLRAEARRSGRQLPPVAIFTTQPDLFEKEVPAVGPARPIGGSFVGREAHLAPVLDVEWLFAKNGDKAGVASRIASLARAQEIACASLGNDGATFEELVTFLGLGADLPWRTAARSSIERARPPVSEALGDAASFRGPVAAVRWLIHETLPYPGAFLSDSQVASRLGTTAAALAAVERNPTTEWARGLAGAVYAGPAANLFSRRWWAAGVADAALTVGIAIREGEDRPAALRRLSGDGAIGLLRMRDPVAIVGGDLMETGMAPASACVQLRPRGWPPQSDEPWMRIIDAAAAPWFRHMVDPSDRSLFAGLPEA